MFPNFSLNCLKTCEHIPGVSWRYKGLQSDQKVQVQELCLGLAGTLRHQEPADGHRHCWQTHERSHAKRNKSKISHPSFNQTSQCPPTPLCTILPQTWTGNVFFFDYMKKRYLIYFFTFLIQATQVIPKTFKFISFTFLFDKFPWVTSWNCDHDCCF